MANVSRKLPGGPYVTEVATQARKLPGYQYLSETVSVGGGGTFKSAFARNANIVIKAR